jgi:hypothetical protein
MKVRNKIKEVIEKTKNFKVPISDDDRKAEAKLNELEQNMRKTQAIRDDVSYFGMY